MLKQADENVFLTIVKLMSLKGIHFTTEELARELGTSKRTVYMYFANKEEIIDQTISFIFAGIHRSDQQIASNASLAYPDKLKQVAYYLPDGYQLGILVRHADDLRRYYPIIWTKVRSYIDAGWDRLIALVEEGMHNGVVRHIDTQMLRIMLDQTLIALLSRENAGELSVSFEQEMKAMFDIVLHGILIES
ncbi:helix-turn-helix domain-containing protein [Paenibacillus sp. NPDC058071]|uniref:TetR/AcrR family transcriptional regulator n=1 Tax=Paenibacillus sp. NPDC058071 TaxID=3346326 RepID=UPI0036DC1EBC